MLTTYYTTQKQLKTEARANAEELAADIAAELNSGFETIELFKDLYHVYGDLFLKDFYKICEELTKDNLAIGSMYFAPKGVIKYSYPEKVDPATSNFEMLKDPIQGPKAIKAIQDRKATIAGPHALIEGGEGFIIRNPIFKGDEFIAFSIIVLDKQRLLNQVVNKFKGHEYNFAIWKEPDTTAVIDSDGYIMKHLKGTDRISRDVQLSFNVLNDTWHITLEPMGGWNVHAHMKTAILASFAVLFILIALLYLHALAVNRKRQLDLEILSGKAKSSFLFSMSHDIRTPMNAIIGFADLMRKNLDNKDKLTDYLNKLNAASNFLLSLINNVLEMARIESGKMHLEENTINVQTFEDITDAVFADLAQNKGIVFSNEYKFYNQYVIGDEMKLRELTLNIVSNAIKYTPKGGFVKLSLHEGPCDKPGYTLFTAIAEDSGIGISKEYLPHIFEEFSREKNSTESKIAGTGLGMPIVKKLIDLMEGSIDIQSEVGVGTKITVKVPLRIATAEESETAQRNEEQNKQLASIAGLKNKAADALGTSFVNKSCERIFEGKQILLAEDNDLNAEIAIALLQDLGLKVDRAVDGKQCVEMLQQSENSFYSLILMDIQMPNMDGYEATSAIRSMEDPGKSATPIIAMTANAFDEDRKKSFDSGMNGHVAKPINVPELVKALTQAFNNG